MTQTAIWPLSLAFVGWVWPQLCGGRGRTLELELALGEGLQIAALVLWIALLVWTFCRRAGWCESYLGYSPEVCRQLRWAIALGCLAAVLFLVPRHILRTASGDPEMAHTSLALVRLCFTAFEVVILGLVGAVLRRGSTASDLSQPSRWSLLQQGHRFVPRPQDRALTAHEILLRIDDAFRQHGVDIPFPQRDVHVRSVAAAIEVRPLDSGQAPSPPAA